MAFERKTWIDRQAEFPARRKLAPTGTADVYDVSREEGLILEEGDPFNASTMNALEGRIEAALNDTILPATCTYSSGVFTLTGLPTALPDIFTVRFKAPADFTEGDTLSINALPYALFMPNQQPAQAGAFAQNAVVSLNVDLATGKAFLAGGGGSSGEWEEVLGITPTNPSQFSSYSLVLNVCHALSIVQISATFTVNISGGSMASFGLTTDNLFTGSYSHPLLTGFIDGKITSTWYPGRVLLSLSSGRLALDAELVRGADGMSGIGTGSVIRLGGSFYLPPEHWL